ncbi:hypothetical protein [Natronocalculus amylovorans]|uniref:Uncharacterized protein n=1 Tax=Natronocalculus amylovorans TaxID=2917812 RepID=A0AAE3K8C5_9EURY|nr:hypothetical protein [Natronocalculus amylovorans]MCL9817152.1 hypothetical protein [Natronocalculus amylovorans]
MMLSAEDIDRYVEQYQAVEPLYPVESEAIETLPTALQTGEYGWKDTEWIVQWCFRRYLGDYPDTDRRRIEDAFATESFELVHTAISTAADTDDLHTAADALTALSGVDIYVASALLFFISPEQYLVIGPREWEVLSESGFLDRTYPASLTIDAYQEYLTACTQLATETDRSFWECYMGLWQCWKSEVDH